MKPPNEDGRGEYPAASQNLNSRSKFSQPTPAFKPDSRGGNDEEQRRNSALCFANRDKTEEWHADFLGVLVAEDLPTGSKVWVNVRKKTDKNGKPYLVVALRPWATRAGSK